MVGIFVIRLIVNIVSEGIVNGMARHVHLEKRE